MADFQNTIDVLGDTVVAGMIVDRTIESFADNVITKIGTYAFYGCSALVSVDIPNVTSIDRYAFQSCSALTSVNIPNVTSIGNTAFQSCAFTSIDMPNVTSLASNVFSACKNLVSVNMPKVPKLEGNTFFNCQKLTSIDMPNVTSIGNATFSSCKNLNTIVLRKAQVCTLSNTNAFNSTPFASGGTGGTVYVPQALIESYRTATNWSTLYAAGTCNFVAIEGSEYE
jgi:hypothetical protein